MKKCLKITLSGDVSSKLLSHLHKEAKQLRLEGVARAEKEGGMHIIVCGEREEADGFVDALHKELAKLKLDIEVEVEPFIRDKDYRGVFRVIE